MPCFSCKCFSDGIGRHGEKLNGGRGYCELRDQEYWRGHECSDFAPVWYGPETSGSALKEPQSYGFFDLFKRKVKETKSESKKDSPNKIPAASFFNTSTHHNTFNFETDDSVYEDLDEYEYEEDLEYIDESDSHDAIFEVIDEPDCIVQDLKDIGGKQVVSQPSKRLKTVQKNITIDEAVFVKYGLVFKCNLVEEYDTLLLNFELNNTRGLLSKINRGDNFTIKANVYDIRERLLCIEEVWVEYNQLKSNYAADYFYFSSDSMDKAHSIRVYAVDPSDDSSEDEGYSSASYSPTDIRQFLLNETNVARFNEILKDSLHLIETTVYPKTFFDRYEDALSNAKKTAETTHIDGHKAYAQEVISKLTTHRSEKIKAFIDRCNSQEKLYTIKNDLLSGNYDIPPDLMAYIEGLVREIETQDEDAPENGEYIYCSISFSSDGKTYYYKTNDESLKCGDEVIVPVGKEGRKGIARIEKIERFAAGKTPYPPSLTKDILGKCPY